MPPLDPQLVLGAYAVGVFPMSDAREADSVFWVEPKRRAILPIEAFRPSHSLRKTLRNDRFRVTADTAFRRVLRLCAEGAADRPETWINHAIEDVFVQLHRMGFAHSVECWDGETLVGGLYGLALGRAFFGESMVSRATDASKVALAWLVARLRAGGFTLLDCQFQTDHLASMGTVEIDRADYMVLLSEALSGVIGAASAPASASGDFFALDRGAGSESETVSGPLSGKAIAQLLIHTS
ncbi:leucyl/phenylalanyl-tRNA--protein transferase [Sphingomonas sp. CROZ-RG-20F-R02-07]|uniref:leucyl/phenylalanyl-tRNA--protein transferase n=1 Tax=Sphingomonas sp. CROZ-RG-20F-R02-07 TaxID=2914832 RepID=UPI001F59F03B|nr:leucyl/phenylalanyl-tRNA--protein transferase [Sphingomonas sp. CROZ-RG-20F-R02-07]